MSRSAFQCGMDNACPDAATHIGEKGFIYCAKHAQIRKEGGRERCRKMRRWELELVAEGKQVPSYAPITKAEAVARQVAAQKRERSSMAHVERVLIVTTGHLTFAESEVLTANHHYVRVNAKVKVDHPSSSTPK